MENLIMLVDEVKKEAIGNETIEKEVISLEHDYLRKVINIAKKGLIYEKIEIKEIVYHGNCTDDIVYFTDENGKLVKGTLLDSIELSRRESYEECNVTERELFLLQNGDLTVFYYQKSWGNYEEEESIAYRSVSKNQEIADFDIDYIVKKIERQLEERLKSLRDRNRKQLERLEKLREIML